MAVRSVRDRALLLVARVLPIALLYDPK